MDSQMNQQIREQIAKTSQIGIVVGKNPSLDHMAAALSLYLSLTHLGKQAAIASPTDPIVEISNLVGIDKVKKTLGSSTGDLIVSFPYREGEIEKVSYNLTDGLLNIVVKAGEKGLNFQEKDIMFKRSAKGFQTLFFIGISKLADVESIITPDQMKESAVINIDTNMDNEKYGNIVAVSPTASSLSEQIADLLTLIDPAILDVDIAQNLLSGISFATNDFQDSKTSAIAFEMAGILMRKGASRPKREESKPQPQPQFAQKPFQPRYQPVARPAQPFRPQYQPVGSNGMAQPVAPVQTPKPVSQPIEIPVVQPQQPTSVVSQPVQSPDSSSVQSQTQAQEQPEQKAEFKNTPADWLTPKVYKGSTVV